MGIANMVATIPGFAIPAFVGAMTNSNVSLIYFLCKIIFLKCLICVK